MEDRRDDIIFFEELSPERRDAVRDAIRTDHELARTFAQWRQIRGALREQLHAHVPDRRLLVLYALDDAGQGDALSPDEHAELDAALDDIEQALDMHPGLADAVQRIQDDREAFESAWTAHAAAQKKAERPVAERRPGDRAARPPRARRSGSTTRRWAWRVGAIAAVAVIAIVGVLMFSEGPSQTVVATGPGEVQQVDLADGSTVRLMANSRLAYSPARVADDFSRQVTLGAGRAFFEVAASSQPFVVETPTARTTVLGTSFGVEARAGETRVVVADGRVEVASRTASDAPVALAPGQSSQVPQDAAPTAPEAVDVADALGWTQLFLFRDTPMDRIADRLAQHYQMPVAVDPALRDQAVTGTFEHAQPLPDVLNALAATLNARVVSADDGYRLQPRTGS
jgi:ferric-dicitrate binding protein FerR (iron transport regulator)